MLKSKVRESMKLDDLAGIVTAEQSKPLAELRSRLPGNDRRLERKEGSQEIRRGHREGKVLQGYSRE